jgi:nucleotide-binding universal stress UspA family protein
MRVCRSESAFWDRRLDQRACTEGTKGANGTEAHTCIKQRNDELTTSGQKRSDITEYPVTRTSAMMFESILCPVDFSTHSRDALRHAVGAAHRFGGRVTVMFVNDPLLLIAASRSSGGRREFVERTRVELARFVNRSIATLPPMQSEIAFVVSTGIPADEILRTAKQRRSDLVVMGTQGLTGFQKLFFGSTTEQVLRRVAIPVLAIPPSKRTRPKSPLMVISRVIAPLDLAGEWQSDAVRAANVAAAFDAELVLVHVLAQIQVPPWLRSASSATDRRRIETARKALERVKTKLPSDLNITARVLEGNPAHEIARLTRGSPSLLVMSLRGGAGVWGARRGSIAYHVLTHASRPLLTVPRRRLGGRLSKRLSKAVTDALSERDRIEIAGIDALLSSASTQKRAHPSGRGKP